jgi:diacylglycerol O-acyltransferase / wax synthase
VRPIDRVSANDLTELVTETATAPMQMAAILRLEEPVGCDVLRSELSRRVAAVPRLRQCLEQAPIGLGRPIWVDDAHFDINRQLYERQSPDPRDESTLLQAAAAAAVERLPRDRPLWALTLLTDQAGACSALVLVVHHALADGIGGLAALAQLVDGAPPTPNLPFPTAPPPRSALLSDAVRSRLGLVRSLRQAVPTLRDAATELRKGRSKRKGQTERPARCSLNAPIGRRRQLAIARCSLQSLAAAAHRHGATINDILLTAVAGSIQSALVGRGESVSSLVISVPVSARQEAAASRLGNQVGVIPVTVPTRGEPLDRLAAIAGTTRAEHYTSGRGASVALYGPAFRILARIGLFQWFINNQRLVNTFVTNVRGPKTPLFLLGARITEIIAISPIAGNVTAAFAALSYAGTLIITVIADPERCPDLDQIAAELQHQLNQLAAA